MTDILDLQKFKVDGLITKLQTDYYRLLRSNVSQIPHLREEVELIKNSPGITEKQKETLTILLSKIDALEK